MTTPDDGTSAPDGTTPSAQPPEHTAANPPEGEQRTTDYSYGSYGSYGQDPTRSADGPAGTDQQQASASAGSPAPASPVGAAPGQESPAAPAQGSPSAPGQGSPAAAGPQAMPTASSSMSTEQVVATLRGAGLESPLRSLAVGGVAYVGALLTSLVAVLLSAAAMAVGAAGTGEVGDELDSAGIDPEGALSGIAMIVRMPFQLVAMASFGSWGTHAEFEGVALRASVRLLPFVVTLVMVLLAFYGGRFVQRGRSTGLLGIWVSALITGIATALFTVLAALVLAQPVPLDEGFSLRVHAAGFDAFFGSLLLITLAIGLGRMSRRARWAWWPLVADLPAAAKLAVVHALVIGIALGVLGAIGTTIQALADGKQPPVFVLVLLLPLLGGQMIAALTGLPLLSSLTAKANAPDLLGEFLPSSSFTGRATVFDLPWYAWLITILVGIGVLLVVSLPWNHGRRIVPGNIIALVVSWAALPVVYFAGGIVLLVLARVSVSVGVEGGFFGGGEQMSGSVGLAWWTPFLALLAGVIVEVLSRFFAPLLVPVLSRRALSWFRRPLAPADASAGANGPGSPATGVAEGTATGAPTGVPAGAPFGSAALGGGAATGLAAGAATGLAGGAAAGGATTVDMSGSAPGTQERRPLSKKARRRLIAGFAGAGAICVLVVGLVIAYNVIARTVYAPEKSVDAYLSALEDGSASQASELAPANVPTAQQVLLTDEIAGAAAQRPDSHEITATDRQDDGSAQVTARITQDGVTSERTFTVERAGRSAVVFPSWRLGAVEYSTLRLVVDQGTSTILVNDQEVDVSDLDLSPGYVDLPALPGTYTVSLPAASDLVTVTDSEVPVLVEPSGDEDTYASPFYQLSEAGLKEVQKQVNARIDECATSKDAAPEDCPFEAYVYDQVDDSGSWKIEDYPTVTVEEEDGWYFSTGYEDAGSAVYSYKQEPFLDDEKPTDETSDSSITVSGAVTVDDDGKLSVQYSEY
ncbi:hypothetical protein I8D64_16430 [Brachybacterium sp. MASK1Z-5]|uniref:Uncharacterized protein n=1 Tax=Brachybacterium halotolerans TaxID=2795215 RepID=A0ABS1BEB6_9MICO|nr:hypothetical protein [Brachybacterium halotolerans]MBK0332990.1 hypothetical protein [Brachybacterium halotolerans]